MWNADFFKHSEEICELRMLPCFIPVPIGHVNMFALPSTNHTTSFQLENNESLLVLTRLQMTWCGFILYSVLIIWKPNLTLVT
jgi:hypothetical protein